MTSKEELKRLAYENACCRCQYYKNGKCNNKGTCVWKQIIQDLDRLEKLEKTVGILKENKITALKLTWDGTWWTIDVPNNKNFYPVVYGKGKEKYDLLNEVFGNDR